MNTNHLPSRLLDALAVRLILHTFVTAKLPGLCGNTCYLTVAFSFCGSAMLHDDFPRAIPQQVARLIQLGLQGSPDEIARRLRAVSYYRLSSYWHPYLNNDGAFKDATSIDDIWNRYMFDRELRLLLLDAIERIEVCMRTTIAHRHATHFGPFSYAHDINSLQENAGRVTRTQWHERVHHEVRQNREILLTRTKDRNGDTHTAPPVWVATEVMSMGTIVTFFNLCHSWMRKVIANDFGTSERVFSTWLLALLAGRNIAAHHGRLWNRELGMKPLIPFPVSRFAATVERSVYGHKQPSLRASVHRPTLSYMH